MSNTSKYIVINLLFFLMQNEPLTRHTKWSLDQRFIPKMFNPSLEKDKGGASFSEVLSTLIQSKHWVLQEAKKV